MKNFCHIVGLSCEGVEDQLMAVYHDRSKSTSVRFD